MAEKNFNIAILMQESGVKFGTSGARGLVTDMTDEVCYAYTAGFIQYLEQRGELKSGSTMAVGGDLRASTDRIMQAVAQAISDRGYQPHNCGKLPSPALALYGLTEGIPTAMVTGSHIPDDRNGIKYTTKTGEILKSDEAGMKKQTVIIPDGRFDPEGMLVSPGALPQADDTGIGRYRQRYLDVFGADCLQGAKIGVFQHSAVGRELMVDILRGLGAEVVPLGFSTSFIPVDTEAIRPEDVESAKQWAAEYSFDAIVSTDGDSDRPLVADENGKWLRGDVAGILVAKFLGADAVVTPVSCNTAVEKCGFFGQVIRTQIGSPYVIEAMQAAELAGAKHVVGYEANGGFLQQTAAQVGEKTLALLPTRDAVIVHLAILLAARQMNLKVSELAAKLPQRFTISDRLKQFPTEKSHAKIKELNSGHAREDRAAIEKLFKAHFGAVKSLNAVDGLRITFESEEVVHLRPSGNAPEFRCYTEADTESRAQEINRICIGIMSTWK